MAPESVSQYHVPPCLIQEFWVADALFANQYHDPPSVFHP